MIRLAAEPEDAPGRSRAATAGRVLPCSALGHLLDPIRVPRPRCERRLGYTYAVKDIVAILERELGPGAIVGPGHERLDDYGRDESPLPEFFPPECAVLCEST